MVFVHDKTKMTAAKGSRRHSEDRKQDRHTLLERKQSSSHFDFTSRSVVVKVDKKAKKCKNTSKNLQKH